MGTYQFEAMFGICDVFEVEADSYEEAMAEAEQEAAGYYAVHPSGFSMSWDDIEFTCISEPDEDED